MFKHSDEYYQQRLSKLAQETFDPNPNFPFGSKQSINGNNTIVEEFEGYYKLYRNESVKNILQTSLTSYTAIITFKDGKPNINIKMKKSALVFYTIWGVFFLTLTIYLISKNDFSWMMFAIMLMGACIHIPIGKRKFKKFAYQFLNSL